MALGCNMEQIVSNLHLRMNGLQEVEEKVEMTIPDSKNKLEFFTF